jgi:hypothetical protein
VRSGCGSRGVGREKETSSHSLSSCSLENRLGRRTCDFPMEYHSPLITLLNTSHSSQTFLAAFSWRLLTHQNASSFFFTTSHSLSLNLSVNFSIWTIYHILSGPFLPHIAPMNSNQSTSSASRSLHMCKLDTNSFNSFAKFPGPTTANGNSRGVT